MKFKNMILVEYYSMNPFYRLLQTACSLKLKALELNVTGRIKCDFYVTINNG